MSTTTLTAVAPYPNWIPRLSSCPSLLTSLFLSDLPRQLGNSSFPSRILALAQRLPNSRPHSQIILLVCLSEVRLLRAAQSLVSVPRYLLGTHTLARLITSHLPPTTHHTTALCACCKQLIALHLHRPRQLTTATLSHGCPPGHFFVVARVVIANSRRS